MNLTIKRGVLLLSSAMLVALSVSSLMYADSYITKLDPNKPSPTSLVTFSDDQAKDDFLDNNGLDESDLTPTDGLDKTYVVPVPNNKLKSDEGVKVAPRREYRAVLTPNDPIYPQWYTTNIAAPTAWDTITGSGDVTVAVIDTGYGLAHEDMANRWAINSGEYGGGKDTNGLDDDSNGRIDDWRGWDFLNNDNDPSTGTSSPNGDAVSHGTITAGLIGSTGNNAIGVASVNWAAPVLPLQILSDNGVGFTEDLTAAINYAVARGAKVISLSLGSTGADPTVEAAINSAVSSGVTVIAAAGNCGDPASYFINGCDYASQMLFPAKYSNVLAVGAVDQSDNRAGFSSYGPELDILAPGSGTIRAPSWSQANQTSLYTNSVNGTSFATPIVSGTAALIYSRQAAVTPGEVLHTLISTTDKTSQMSGSMRTDQHGYGRLNVSRSINYLSVPHPDGTLIYTPGHSGVVLVEGGKRRNIVSGSVFDSYGYDWSKIKEPTVADSHLVADTDLNTHREGTLLESGGGIYVIDVTAGGQTQKRPFYSWDAFVGLGYSLSQTIKVSASELPAANGTPITDASTHPDGTLIYNASHSGVQIIEAGQLRNIVSGSVFQSNSFRWDRVKNPTAGDLAMANGVNMSYQREGSLVLAGGSIYAIDVSGVDTQKRHIGSWDTFVGLSYSLSEVFSISKGELPSQNGTIIIY